MTKAKQIIFGLLCLGVCGFTHAQTLDNVVDEVI